MSETLLTLVTEKAVVLGGQRGTRPAQPQNMLPRIWLENKGPGDGSGPCYQSRAPVTNSSEPWLLGSDVNVRQRVKSQESRDGYGSVLHQQY